MRINGQPQQIIPPSTFALSSLPASDLEFVDLLADGNTSVVWFDSVCQRRVGATTGVMAYFQDKITGTAVKELGRSRSSLMLAEQTLAGVKAAR